MGGHTTHKGYMRSVSGETIVYHSPLPGPKQALITRADGGWSPIVWETEPVPSGARPEAARFTWLAGLGCNLGSPAFSILVAGSGPDPHRIAFHTVDAESWSVEGPAGMTLRFQGLLRDHHGDRFGLMSLEAPHDLLEPGRPLRLEIAGENASSQAWVMTFEEPLEEGISVAPIPILLRRPGGGAQPCDVTVLRLAHPTEALIRAEGIDPVTRPVPVGLTTVRLELPPVLEPTPVAIEIEMDGETVRREAVLEPVRRWTVHLIQHTHTDIGYTRPQSEILAEHLRYIDSALDYCDATDGEPDASRFRWTCEVSWPVREYLRLRPPRQVERLERRVREGRIELTAMPLNMGEVADERVLAGALRWIGDARARGLPVETAMQNDVNGFAWCLLDPLAELGVRFVSMGENAHRALRPFDRPTTFWWESPSGKRLLAYRADHYMTANFWGILAGDLDRFGSQLVAYLRDLAAKGYPGDAIAVQYVGYFTDNAPPSTFANDLIRRWNETVEWPRLQTSTMGRFLAAIADDRTAALPVHRKAWPDWWTDGFGSAMRETAAVRRTQGEQIANLGLLAIAVLLGAEMPAGLREQAEAIDDLLLFYDEHTFGSAESITDPLGENSQVQWLEKSSYAWQALMQSRLLREAALGLLEPFLPAGTLPAITVCNTLNWTRSGPVILFIDHQILPRDATPVIQGDGRAPVAMQRLSSRAEGSTWMLWAEGVPPLGHATVRIGAGATSPAESPGAGSVAGTPGPDAANAILLENRWYRLSVDPGRGGIVSLHDKDLRRDLLDPRRDWELGQVIGERLDSRASMEHLKLGGHRRCGWSDLRLDSRTDGAIWRGVRFSAVLEGFDHLLWEIRLYETEKRLELVYLGRKKPVTDPEAIYVALPFFVPDGRLYFEAQGAEVSPGRDQLAGTASDWNTVQSYAALRGPDGQIVVVSEEAPLMQFGGINTGRYDYEGVPASGRMVSWVLNNYWVTNFRASQEGDLRWSYQITSMPARAGDTDPRETAARFGWGARVPMVGRVRPPVRQPRPGVAVPGIDLGREGLLLLHAEPFWDGRGIVLHLRETGGRRRAIADLGAPAGWRVIRVDALGKPLPAPVGCEGGPALDPYGTCFVRMEPPQRT